ncbi:MAG TPA: RidA family protein [Actinomycetota bacterium]|nr:RidA family protein [Actinomycetota bacterium]
MPLSGSHRPQWRSSFEEAELTVRAFNPRSVAGPFAAYSHGVELRPPVRMLFGAGQTGVAEDGRIGVGIEEQAELTWRNIQEVLAGAGMEVSDIVQLTMYLLHREDYPAARAVREEVLGGHRPASTLVYVAGLANPDWLIEVDFVAARADDQTSA